MTLYRFPAARIYPPAAAAAQGSSEGESPSIPAPLVVPCFVVVDPDVFEDMRWCAECGGMQRFIPLERWPGGWRGLCWGCEQEKYVLIQRSESEAA